MEETRGEAEIRSEAGEVRSHLHLRTGGSPHHSVDEVPSPVERLREEARGRFGDVGNRASGFAEHVRGSLAARVERSDVLATIREYPLTAVSLAASAGFLVAFATASTERSWVVERARRQLRAAIISGLTAAVAHELRSIVGTEDGLGQFIHSVLGDSDEEDDDSFET
jgi:hypothetical protein